MQVDDVTDRNPIDIPCMNYLVIIIAIRYMLMLARLPLVDTKSDI